MDLVKKLKKKDILAEELNFALEDIANMSQDDEEYINKLKLIETIYKTQLTLKGRNRDNGGRKIDPATIIVPLCSLLEVIIIVNSEGVRSVTSKALGRVLRPRV